MRSLGAIFRAKFGMSKRKCSLEGGKLLFESLCLSM